MKKIQIVTIIWFYTILAVPLIFFNHKADQVSEIDNRALTDIPHQWTPSLFEKYLEDRMGFRNEKIKAYTVINDKLFHEMIHPIYEYGQEDYVFFKIRPEVIDENYLTIYTDFLAQMQKDCENQDIMFRYWLNPSKSAVYDEYLPKGVTLQYEATNYLIQLLNDKGITYTHSLDVLKEAKETQQVFNRQYDAGHWNDTGAFVGVQELYTDLIESGADIEHIRIENYELEEERFTMLPVSFFSIQDSAMKFVPKIDNAKTDERYTGIIELDETYRTFEHHRNLEQEDKPKLLIFHGSYLITGERYKFLLEHFSEVTRVHNYRNVQKYQEYIDLLNPDIVIFESADYVINESYFPVELIGR